MMRKGLLLLLLMPLCSAVCITNASFDSAMPIIAAAIMLSISVSAIAYMAGSLLRDPHLLVFSKDQLFHTFISVLLVLTIQGIFDTTCMVASQALDGKDMMDESMTYLRSLRVDGGQMLVSIMKTSIQHKFDAVDYLGYYAPFLGGENFWYNSYKNAYARHLEILFDMVMAGYISAGVQYNIIGILPQVAISIMVPMGILIRSIPKARESGNVILAIALAIYVVLPFTYAAASVMQDTKVDWFEYTGGTDESGISFQNAALYLFQTIFMPNLSLVVFATAVGGLVKVAKVIP